MANLLRKYPRVLLIALITALNIVALESCSKEDKDSIQSRGIKVDNIYYLLNDDNRTAQVTFQKIPDNYPKISGNITIPQTINIKGTEYTVTAIGDSAFMDADGLTSITLPKTVTKLGFRAFSFSGLTNIDNMNSITDVGQEAFRNTNLTSIELPQNIKSIPDFMFYHTPLEEIIIPEGVKTISQHAFHGCKNLRNVKYPSTLETIGGWAFSECENLTEIELPITLTKIGQQAFSYCGFEEIKLPPSVDNLGIGAFEHCDNLRICYMSPNVKQLPADLFQRCYKMTELVFYNHVMPELPKPKNDGKTQSSIFGDWEAQSIKHTYSENEHLIANLKRFNSIIFTIPMSTNAIGLWEQTTVGNDEPRKDHTPRNSPYYNDPGMPGYYPDYEIVNHLYYALNRDDKTATLVSRQGQHLWDEESLQKHVHQTINGYYHGIAIPDTIYVDETPYAVTEIGKYAFDRYPYGYYVVLAKTIKKIDDFAFAHTRLLGIELNQGLEEIGVSAFENTQLDEIILPRSLKRVLSHAFSDNEDLKGIFIFQKGAYFSPSYITNCQHCKGYSHVDEDEFYMARAEV